MIDTLNEILSKARLLRIYAETTNNPQDYELAAAYFELAGMELAAQRCRDRAALYSTPNI
jgi:hypothetical protein